MNFIFSNSLSGAEIEAGYFNQGAVALKYARYTIFSRKLLRSFTTWKPIWGLVNLVCYLYAKVERVKYLWRWLNFDRAKSFVTSSRVAFRSKTTTRKAKSVSIKITINRYFLPSLILSRYFLREMYILIIVTFDNELHWEKIFDWMKENNWFERLFWLKQKICLN